MTASNIPSEHKVPAIALILLTAWCLARDGSTLVGTALGRNLGFRLGYRSQPELLILFALS